MNFKLIVIAIRKIEGEQYDPPGITSSSYGPEGIMCYNLNPLTDSLKQILISVALSANELNKIHISMD